MPIRVAVAGATGRMGQALAGLIAQSEDFELVGGIAHVTRADDVAASLRYPRIHALDAAAEILAAADVLIDFSSPELLGNLLGALGTEGSPGAVVIGTTGFDDGTRAQIDDAATRRAVMVESNFSVGVQLLTSLAATAAARLPAAEYDAEIVETHHRAKVDAPSGTALTLAEAVADARSRPLAQVRRDGRTGRSGPRPEGEIGMHAVRGGDVIGEHRVLFLGARERLELVHAASDRSVFAAGALVAAKWLAGRSPGRYAFRQALSLD